MKLSNSFSVMVFLASTIFPTALCAPQGTPTLAEPALVDFFTQPNYQGDTYYIAHGNYSTCYSVAANLQKVIKSLKLGPGVKECRLYEDGNCKDQNRKDAEYKEDQPTVKLPWVSSLKCNKD